MSTADYSSNNTWIYKIYNLQIRPSDSFLMKINLP